MDYGTLIKISLVWGVLSFGYFSPAQQMSALADFFLGAIFEKQREEQRNMLAQLKPKPQPVPEPDLSNLTPLERLGIANQGLNGRDGQSQQGTTSPSGQPAPAPTPTVPQANVSVTSPPTVNTTPPSKGWDLTGRGGEDGAQLTLTPMDGSSSLVNVKVTMGPSVDDKAAALLCSDTNNVKTQCANGYYYWYLTNNALSVEQATVFIGENAELFPKWKDPLYVDGNGPFGSIGSWAASPLPECP